MGTAGALAGEAGGLELPGEVEASQPEVCYPRTEGEIEAAEPPKALQKL